MKTYGAADPALTFTSGSLAFSDAFTGALDRVAGENVGAYAIQQGTLALGSNYALHFLGANLIIDKATPVVAWSGALSGTYNQPATLMASLAFGPGSAISGTAIPGASLTLAMGAQSCMGVTQPTSGEAATDSALCPETARIPPRRCPLTWR